MIRGGGSPGRAICCRTSFPAKTGRCIGRGFRQRLRAFEHFLADVYGKREILRAGAVPIQAVLGSPHFQNASIGLPRPRSAYLHLSGICLARDARGAWQVKHHHFGHATGISYMMQNRRALARVRAGNLSGFARAIAGRDAAR